MFSNAEKERRIAAADKRLAAATSRESKYLAKAKEAKVEKAAAKEALAWLRSMPTDAQTSLEFDE